MSRGSCRCRAPWAGPPGRCTRGGSSRCSRRGAASAERGAGRRRRLVALLAWRMLLLAALNLLSGKTEDGVDASFVGRCSAFPTGSRHTQAAAGSPCQRALITTHTAETRVRPQREARSSSTPTRGCTQLITYQAATTGYQSSTWSFAQGCTEHLQRCTHRLYAGPQKPLPRTSQHSRSPASRHTEHW